MTNVLYVVFHGLVCLVDGRFKNGIDQGFRAYVLADRDKAHKVMYGDFLAEQDFPPSGGAALNLSFQGLTQGTDTSVTLNRTVNPVVDLQAFPVVSGDVLAVITLPRPNFISNLFRGNIGPGTLVNSGRFNPPPSQISAVRIFVYNFGDPSKVLLSDDKGNILWNCPELATVTSKTGPLGVAVFHMYNEPPRTLNNPTPNDHNVHEFNDSMNFLGFGGAGGISITAAAQVDLSTTSPSDTPGVLDREIDALDERNQKTLLKLIKALREGSGIPLGGGGGTQVCGGANGSLP